jgi:hypothetical protein
VPNTRVCSCSALSTNLSRGFRSETFRRNGRLRTSEIKEMRLDIFTATERKDDARFLFPQGFCSLQGHLQARQDPPAPKLPEEMELGRARQTQNRDLSRKKPQISYCKASALFVGFYEPVMFCLLEKFPRNGAWFCTSKTSQDLSRKQPYLTTKQLHFTTKQLHLTTNQLYLTTKQLYLTTKNLYLNHETTILDHETTILNHETTVLNHETTILNHETS